MDGGHVGGLRFRIRGNADFQQRNTGDVHAVHVEQVVAQFVHGLNGSNSLQKGTGGLKTVSIAVLPFAGQAGEILYQLQVVGEPFAAQTYGVCIGRIDLGFVKHDVQLVLVNHLLCSLERAIAVLGGQKPFKVGGGVEVILDRDFRVFIDSSDDIGVDPLGVAGNSLACCYGCQSGRAAKRQHQCQKQRKQALQLFLTHICLLDIWLFNRQQIHKTRDIKDLHHGFINADHFHFALFVHNVLRSENYAQTSRRYVLYETEIQNQLLYTGKFVFYHLAQQGSGDSVQPALKCKRKHSVIQIFLNVQCSSLLSLCFLIKQKRFDNGDINIFAADSNNHVIRQVGND